jgi:thioredoxin 1
MIAPILDETSKDYDGRLQIAKMNVDENREVPAKFGIRGIPTLMLFKGGQLAATKVGALPKRELTAFIDGTYNVVLTRVRCLARHRPARQCQPPRP